MRISDWSSDVCSSDLAGLLASVYSVFRIEETRPRAIAAATEHQGKTEQPGWRDVLGSRAFLAVALVNFSVFFTRASSHNTLMPIKGVSSEERRVGKECVRRGRYRW